MPSFRGGGGNKSRVVGLAGCSFTPEPSSAAFEVEAAPDSDAAQSDAPSVDWILPISFFGSK